MSDAGTTDGTADVMRFVGGGEPGPTERSAIVEAVLRVLRADEGRRSAPTSAWSLAGRLEAVGGVRVRARSGLPRA